MESLELFIQSRPEKTLSNGYNSRWNGSRTPLNYTFLNNRFPVNTVDTVGSITILTTLTNEQGTAVTFSDTRVNLNIDSIGFYILINGTSTSLDGGIYKIINIDPGTSNTVIIGDSFTGSLVGGATGQRYYKGYKALANVYVGSPSYHPYYSDGSKPEYLAGTLEIDFDSNSLAWGNVRNFIKPDITSEFDTTEENSHNLWTSFYIEYAEIWEGNEIPTYTRDTLNGCTTFSDFTDPSFINGDSSWPSDSTIGYNTSWQSNSGNVACGFSSFLTTGSAILYQSKSIIPGNQYLLTIDISFSSSNSTKRLVVFDDQNRKIASIDVFNSSQYTISFNPTFESSTVGFAVECFNRGSFLTCTLNSLNISANSGLISPCDYSSFAVFGTKQFQDALGGNFGDYVLNVVDSNLTPKILTHFEELTLTPATYFKQGNSQELYSNFNNYINAIIPANVFSLSDGGDNVFLQFNTFKGNGDTVDSLKIKIDNKSDGVYAVDVYNTLVLNSFDYGYCQFVITPGNTFVDGNYGDFTSDPMVGAAGSYDSSVWGIDLINLTGTSITSNGTQSETSALPYDFNYSSQLGFSFGTIVSSVNKIHETTSPIDVVEGRTYDFTYFVGIGNGSDNMTFTDGSFTSYWLPSGYLESECNTVFKYAFLDENRQVNQPNNDPIFVQGTTSFTAKATETITLERYLEYDGPSITGGGCDWFYAEMRFKGPIEYVSEQKTIKINTDCFGYKGNTIRWLNDLGGWETWRFKQFQTVKEKFKKTEIKRDIFSDFDNYFINGSTQYDAIAVDSRKSITLRSGLLTDNELEVLSQLQRSIKVQIQTDKETTLGSVTRKETYQTVSIKSGSFVLIEEEKNMHEISFDVNLPDTLTQELW